MDEKNDEKLMTVEEVAELLRFTPTTVYRMAKRGVLPAKIVGRNIRFAREEIMGAIDRGLYYFREVRRPGIVKTRQ